MTPIDKLREALDYIPHGAAPKGKPSDWRRTEARAALDELAAELSAYKTANTHLTGLNDALESQLAAQPKALGHLHCRECNYHPREPINCAHCGAVYCMTRESIPTKGGSDG